MRTGLVLCLVAGGVSVAALWGSPLLVPALVAAGLLGGLVWQGSDLLYLFSAGEGLVVTVGLLSPFWAVVVQAVVFGTCADTAGLLSFRSDGWWLALCTAGTVTMGALVFLFPGFLVAIALLGAAVLGLLVYEHRLSRGADA